MDRRGRQVGCNVCQDKAALEKPSWRLLFPNPPPDLVKMSSTQKSVLRARTSSRRLEFLTKLPTLPPPEARANLGASGTRSLSGVTRMRRSGLDSSFEASPAASYWILSMASDALEISSRRKISCGAMIAIQRRRVPSRAGRCELCADGAGLLLSPQHCDGIVSTPVLARAM